MGIPCLRGRVVLIFLLLSGAYYLWPTQAVPGRGASPWNSNSNNVRRDAEDEWSDDWGDYGASSSTWSSWSGDGAPAASRPSNSAWSTWTSWTTWTSWSSWSSWASPDPGVIASNGEGAAPGGHSWDATQFNMGTMWPRVLEIVNLVSIAMDGLYLEPVQMRSRDCTMVDKECNHRVEDRNEFVNGVRALLFPPGSAKWRKRQFACMVEMCEKNLFVTSLCRNVLGLWQLGMGQLVAGMEILVVPSLVRVLFLYILLDMMAMIMYDLPLLFSLVAILCYLYVLYYLMRNLLGDLLGVERVNFCDSPAHPLLDDPVLPVYAGQLDGDPLVIPGGDPGVDATSDVGAQPPTADGSGVGSVDAPPLQPVGHGPPRWSRRDWDDWEAWEMQQMPRQEDDDDVQFMQRPGNDGARPTGEPRGVQDEDAERGRQQGRVPQQEVQGRQGQPSLLLTLAEEQGLHDAGWPLFHISHLRDFCEYLDWVAREYGPGVAAWGMDAWADALVMANATVELAQETMWARLRDVPVIRPDNDAVRGRLAVGFAGLQRQLNDFHVSMVQEGLRGQWLPQREDHDGRQLPEPPFVRGDANAWALQRARALARAMVQTAMEQGAVQRGEVGPPVHVQIPAMPQTDTDAAEDDAENGADADEEEGDVANMMQVNLEEEARMNNANLQTESRRHLRNLLRALEDIQQHGEGPEYRWGVQALVEAWDDGLQTVSVVRDILARRTSTLGCQPYYPATREPRFGPVRSRVGAYMQEFRFLLLRALAEEVALGLQERFRAGPDASGSVAAPLANNVEAGAVAAEAMRGGRNTRVRRQPRGSRSRSRSPRRPGVREPPGLLPPGHAGGTSGSSGDARGAPSGPSVVPAQAVVPVSGDIAAVGELAGSMPRGPPVVPQRDPALHPESAAVREGADPAGDRGAPVREGADPAGDGDAHASPGSPVVPQPDRDHPSALSVPREGRDPPGNPHWDDRTLGEVGADGGVMEGASSLLLTPPQMVGSELPGPTGVHPHGSPPGQHAVRDGADPVREGGAPVSPGSPVLHQRDSGHPAARPQRPRSNDPPVNPLGDVRTLDVGGTLVDDANDVVEGVSSSLASLHHDPDDTALASGTLSSAVVGDVLSATVLGDVGSLPMEGVYLQRSPTSLFSPEPESETKPRGDQ
ncbi:unnamed protein product [Symbiodinium sp. CCMP2592]|nr:unnamed protein product [Symbiodinium sp. CCMP2592]